MMLLISGSVMTYRVLTPDWYWWSHRPPRLAASNLALADRSALPDSPPIPAPIDEPVAGEAPPSENAASHTADMEPQPEASPIPPGTDGSTPPTANDLDEQIRLEAEHARAERDKLETFKEREAERLAKLPPPRPSRPLRRIDPAEIARMQQRIREQMDGLMALQRRHLDEMLRAHRQWAGRDWAELDNRIGRSRPGRLPGFPDAEAEAEIDRLFEGILRAQERALREMAEEVPWPPIPPRAVPKRDGGPAPKELWPPIRQAPRRIPPDRRVGPDELRAGSRTLTLRDASGNPVGVIHWDFQRGVR
jgi:hypothetical protein